MIDIGDLNESFVLDWVRKIKTNTSTAVSNIPMFYYEKLGGIEVFNSNTNVKSFNGLQYIKPHFWKYALQTWLKNKQIVKENEIPAGKICNQLLWNNNCICYKKNTLFFKGKHF